MTKVLILDTETTGTCTALDEICEISMLLVRVERPQDLASLSDEQIIDELTTRVLTCHPIPASATAVHGIRDEDVQACPTFTMILPRVRCLLLQAEVICGYRVRFDLEILSARLGEDMPQNYRVLDGYSLWAKAEDRTLSSAYARFVGQELVGAHGARADAVAAALVAGNIASRGTELGWYELTEPVERKQYEVNGDDVVLLFGKYSGASLKRIAAHDQGYLAWILRQSFPAELKTEIRKVLDR